VPHANGPAFCERLYTEGSRDDIAIMVMTAGAQVAEYERQCAPADTLPSPLISTSCSPSSAASFTRVGATVLHQATAHPQLTVRRDLRVVYRGASVRTDES
jgi:hypothetical protein